MVHNLHLNITSFQLQSLDKKIEKSKSNLTKSIVMLQYYVELVKLFFMIEDIEGGGGS